MQKVYLYFFNGYNGSVINKVERDAEELFTKYVFETVDQIGRPIYGVDKENVGKVCELGYGTLVYPTLEDDDFAAKACLSSFMFGKADRLMLEAKEAKLRGDCITTASIVVDEGKAG